ncbi:MAG: hypothetical protein ACKOF9_00395 [Burkholderiales bacterium]
MNAIVFEHVPVAELPLAWREKLTSAQVTVRIEEEAAVSAQGTEAPTQAAAQVAAAFANDPLFGMWRDREDMADVAAYVRRIREPRFTEPRFNGDGSRNEFPRPTAPSPDDKNAD